MKLSLDSRLPTTEVGKESDSDIIKKVKLFLNSKTDDDNNNNEWDLHLYYQVLYLYINIISDSKSWLSSLIAMYKKL